MALDHANGFHCLGKRTDLVDLDEQCVAGFFFNRAGHTFRIGHEQVITHDLQAMPVEGGEVFPALPVILGETVFNRDDRVLVDPVGPEFHHLVRGQFSTFLAQVVELGVFFIKLRSSGIEGDCHICAGFVSCFFNRLEDQFHGFVIGAQGRRKPAFITNQGGVTFALEHGLEGGIDLGAPSQTFSESWRAKRHDHEFLGVG